MADIDDDTGEPDMEPMDNVESAPNIKGVDPDLIREEMIKGSCAPSKGMPKTAAALRILGAGKAYGQK